MDKITKAVQKIAAADAVLISASNGLSISEGFNIFANNQDFKEYFSYFQTKYEIGSILQGISTPLPTKDHELFIDRLKQYMVTDYHGSARFDDLKQVITGKEYFIVTSNADTHFQLNGFDPQKIWEVEGNFFGLEMRSPEWNRQEQAFRNFVDEFRDKNVVQLELGIGAANQLIKLPLMRMVAMYMKWSYITLNLAKEINILPVIKDRSIGIAGDLAVTLQQFKEETGNE